MGYKSNELHRTSLYDRVKKLLVSFEWSDCCFSISGKCFKAHKLIMGISSPVFEAMFYGPLSTNSEVIITDIEPDTFQLLLNYIYTDKVEISSIEEAYELFYASKKYILEDLCEMCISFIQANISIDNVITILNYPDFMQDEELIRSALTLFCEHANYLLEENKKQISLTCMRAILESNQMNIAERDLIKHVFKWTTNYCKQNNLPVMFKTRREILIKNGLFKLLRFFILTLDELNEIVSDINNLLLPNETDNIKSAIKGLARFDKTIKNDPLCSTMLPRNSIKLQWHRCHRIPLKSVAPITIDSSNHVIYSRLKATKSVFITSLCIPTRMAPVLDFHISFHNNTTKVYSEHISVSVECESDNSIIKFTNFINTVEYDAMIDINLSEPFFMKKDKWYRISFSWPENRFVTYSYIVEYRDRFYKDHKIMFEFEDLLVITGSNGSFLAGLKFCL